MSRPKRVQPEGPEDTVGNINVSLYTSERRDVARAAAADGDTPGGWMRDLAVGVARGTIKIEREKP